MLSKLSKLSLSGKIFVGLIGGFIFGFILVSIGGMSESAHQFIEQYVVGTFTIIKKLFINALKMVVVPLVLVSLICGTCSLSDPKN